jgi:hypothetical protein
MTISNSDFSGLSDHETKQAAIREQMERDAMEELIEDLKKQNTELENKLAWFKKELESVNSSKTK